MSASAATIGGDDQRWDAEAAHLLGVVEVHRHRGTDLVEQPGEVLRPGREPLVQLVHRGVLHELGGGRADLSLLPEHLRVDRAAADVGRGADEPADLLRVPDRQLHRDPATERVADDVRPVEAEVVDERGDVIGHEPDVQRPVDVGGARVALQVGEDDGVVLGQGRDVGPEHLAVAETSVQQDQRPAVPVRLVVEVDPVDLGVAHDDAPKFSSEVRDTDSDRPRRANSSAGAEYPVSRLLGGEPRVAPAPRGFHSTQ
jgi:hypothetical protein